MRPRRFSCNWERKNGAMMMMSREVHSFTGVCFSVLFLFSCRVTARAPVRELQTAAGHNSFNTHLDVIFNVCSWQMKNTADCSSDNYWYSSVYDLYFLLWPPCLFGAAWNVTVALTIKNCQVLKDGIKCPVRFAVLFTYFLDQTVPYLNHTFAIVDCWYMRSLALGFVEKDVCISRNKV